MQAYAIEITDENLRGVIHSEAGKDYNLADALKWYEEYGGGWFLRDPGSPFDCRFFMPEVFDQMYSFLSPLDTSSLIRPVVRS